MYIKAISENAWERLIREPILRKQMQIEVVINGISLFHDINPRVSGYGTTYEWNMT